MPLLLLMMLILYNMISCHRLEVRLAGQCRAGEWAEVLDRGGIEEEEGREGV